MKRRNIGSTSDLRLLLQALAIYFRAGGWYALSAAVLGIGAGFLPVVAAAVTRQLINDISTGDASARRAVVLAGTVSAATAATALLGQIAAYTGSVVRERVIRSSASRLFDRVAGLRGLRELETPTFHDRLMLAQQSGQTSPATVAAAVQQLGQTLVIIAGFLVVVVDVWPPVAGLLLATAAPTLGLHVIRGRQVSVVAERLAPIRRRAFAFSALVNTVPAAKEMQLLGLGPFFGHRYRSALDTVASSVRLLERRSLLIQAALVTLNAGATAGGLVVVARGATRGDFTVGDVTLFIAAAASVQGAVLAVSLSLGQLAQALRIFRNFDALMKLDEEMPNGRLITPRLSEGLRFDDVWFRYSPESAWVLRGSTFELLPGQSLGIVGANGAGKSTIVKLLCRLYDPDQGAITWDGIDLRHLDIGSLRRRLAATYQDFYCYDLTADENIAIGDIQHPDRRSRGEVVNVARRAGVDAALRRLPHGYDTLLSRTFVDEQERTGAGLSGGEWQRLAFARSLLRSDADLLILDEPNAGLDAAAELELYRTLNHWRRGRSAVLVSHRLAVMTDVDTIVVIDDGRVAECGDHRTLLEAGGIYARLFQIQAAPYQRSVVATGNVVG